MDPDSVLEGLCQRHGVPQALGARLLPLVRWALESPTDIRDRILAIVDETLSWQARGDETQRDSQVAASRSILLSVARVLHDWCPSERILGPGSEPGDAAAE